MMFDKKAKVIAATAIAAGFVAGIVIGLLTIRPAGFAVGFGAVCAIVATAISIPMGRVGTRRRARAHMG